LLPAAAYTKEAIVPFQPREPFNAQIDDSGSQMVIGPGNWFSDDHYVVRRYPEKMQSLEDIIQRPSGPVVERATAEPGESRRLPGRPRREIADL
jgi:hypothetical protein